MTRHPLDAVSLVFGLIFAAVGVAALADAIDFDLFTMEWLWPAVLIGSGVAVLLTLGSREPTPDPAGDPHPAPAEGEGHERADDR